MGDVELEKNEIIKPVLVSKEYNVAPENILGKIKFYITLIIKELILKRLNGDSLILSYY